MIDVLQFNKNINFHTFTIRKVVLPWHFPLDDYSQQLCACHIVRSVLFSICLLCIPSLVSVKFFVYSSSLCSSPSISCSLSFIIGLGALFCVLLFPALPHRHIFPYDLQHFNYCIWFQSGNHIFDLFLTEYKPAEYVSFPLVWVTTTETETFADWIHKMW